MFPDNEWYGHTLLNSIHHLVERSPNYYRGMRALWGMCYGQEVQLPPLQGLSLAPVQSLFCRNARSVPSAFTWSAGMATPSAEGLSPPRSGLERSSFPMNSQATLGDCRNSWQSSVPSAFLVTIYTQRNLLEYWKCSSREIGHTSQLTSA